MRLTQRLLLGALLVVSVLVLLVAVIAGRLLYDRLYAQTVAQLAREARLVASQWTDSTIADSLSDAAGRALGYRVTLLAEDGRVLGDSEYDAPVLATLPLRAERPEVAAALTQSVGVAERPSDFHDGREIYVAVRAPAGIARVSVSTEGLKGIVGDARRDVLISGGLALLIALAMAAAFARSVSQPVEALRDVTQSLAAGDLSRRPALSAPGEVGDLAAAVHRMAEQLDSRLNALQAEDDLLRALIESLNEGVIAVDARRQVVRANSAARHLLALPESLPVSMDVLPRERALREVIAAALDGGAAEEPEVLLGGRTLAITARPLGKGGAVVALLDLTAVRRLESVRRDFVANVSHELKTPLTVISGFAETLTSDDVPPEQRVAFVEAIRANAHRMQRIVDDLLDLSRIESGGWVPKPAEVDLHTIADEAATACGAAADAKGITIARDIAPDAQKAWADPFAIRQMLGNLVDNSVRYTPSGGSIVIVTRREPDAIAVEVKDTGIGIASEHLHRIFERFYRVDHARSRDQGGTGLGLAIVRHLAEAHGGRVLAESELGRGTTITIRLPVVG